MPSENVCILNFEPIHYTMHTITWPETPSTFGSNVCRLCANVSDVLMPMYSDSNEDHKIEFKIRKCLPIMVRKDDDKPQQVCLECVTKLNVSFELLERSLAAEYKFESTLESRVATEKETTKNVSIQGSPALTDQRSIHVNGEVQLQTQHLSEHSSPRHMFVRDASQPTRLWDMETNTCPTQEAPEHDSDVDDCGLIATSHNTSTSVSQETGNNSAENGVAPSASLMVHAAHLSSDGVIVLGKAEGIRNTSVNHAPGSHEGDALQGQATAQQVTDGDCQDILVMVELKYKDVLVGDPRVEASATHHSEMPAFISADSTNQTDLATVSIEANASAISSTSTLVPQTTVVLDASGLRANVVTDNPVQEIKGNGGDNETIPSQENHLGEEREDKSGSMQAPQSDKPFSCTVCNKSFMRKTNLNAHMGIHTQVKPHGCEICGKHFAVRWDLTLHKRIHSGIYACEFCGKAFAVKGKLERHRRVHTGERPFACSMCPKAFGDKRNLEAHRRTHTGEKPFSCKVCGRSFRVNSHLSDHRRVHSQEKPFTCHICGKSFKWKTNLNIHLKLHAGEHFSCEVCSREFVRKADLQKHFRGHTGDKPFTCDICDKRFSERASLQKHIKCHSEEKPHTCDICGKHFLFLWYLNAHKKTHLETALVEYACSRCGGLMTMKKGIKSGLCVVCSKEEDIPTLTSQETCVRLAHPKKQVRTWEDQLKVIKLVEENPGEKCVDIA